MPDETGELYGRWADAALKFDYFVTGLAATILAYSVHELPASQYSAYRVLVPISWLLLVIAVGAGLVRISSMVEILKLAYPTTLLSARQQALRAGQRGSAGLRKSETGETWTATEIEAELAEAGKNLKIANDSFAKLRGHATWAYRVRNWALIGALLLIGVARLAGV